MWKTVPGFNRYEVSDKGDVRTAKTGKKRKTNISAWGYETIAVISDVGKRITTSVHRLVCRAFHGEPPHPKAVVHHKDGVKHHNWPDNLEWTTHSGNTYHALDNDLVTNTSHILVNDTTTGETFGFKSISAAGRYFSITDYQVRQLVSDQHGSLHLDRYVFTLAKPPKRKSRIGKTFYGFDLVAKKLYAAESVPQMAVATGISETRIKPAEKREQLVKGFFFWWDSDRDYTTKIARFTEEDIQASIDNYVDAIEYHFFDYATRRWNTFATLRDLADSLTVDCDSLYHTYNRRGVRLACGGYIHAGNCPDVPPPLPVDVHEVNRQYFPYPARPIKVVHHESGTITYYRSANALRKKLGMPVSSFQRKLDNQTLPGVRVEAIPYPVFQDDSREQYRQHLREKAID